jgi:hypothetical protein
MKPSLQIVVAAFGSLRLSPRGYAWSNQTDHCKPISENPRPEMGT